MSDFWLQDQMQYTIRLWSFYCRAFGDEESETAQWGVRISLSWLHWKYPCAWLQLGGVSSLSINTWLSLVPQFPLVEPFSCFPNKKWIRREIKGFFKLQNNLPLLSKQIFLPFVSGRKQNILLSSPSVHEQLFSSQKFVTTIAKGKIK